MTKAPALRLLDHSYLIVDDEAYIRRLMERVLRRMGANRVRLADGGAQALASLDAEGHPDIVLCDLNMPDMDGVEVLRHLVERGFAGAILFVSGEDRRLLDTAVQLGNAHALTVLGALSKPVQPEHLSALLGAYQPAAKARPQSRGPVEVSAEDLAQALEANRLTVHFQPKVAVADRRVVGVETLVRWIDPDKGFIPPDAFVGVAESHGLIDRLTDRVFDLAMTQAAQWRARGWDLKVAVNVSMPNLSRLDFVTGVVETLGRLHIPGDRVILEVTESRLMADLTTPLEILARLRLKGLGLSIDDFGTGFSSMEQLKRIPFTELKVDRAFVHGARGNDTARAILESSVSLAKTLGLSVVAEGVEDQSDWDLVAAQGVDLVQGYFIAKPQPAEAFDAWHEAWMAEVV